MDTWHILAIYLGIFLLGRYGAKWAMSQIPAGQEKTLKGVGIPLGIVMVVSCFFGACFFLNDSSYQLIFLCYALMAIGLAVVVLYDVRALSGKTFLASLVLCFASTYLFPRLPIFDVTGVYNIVGHFALAGIWVILMWLVIALDRVPFLSLTLSGSFVFFYCLLSGVLFDVVPQELGYIATILFIVQVGVTSYLKNYSCPILGPATSAFVGFMWGALAVYIMAEGYLMPINILYAYPIMEVGLSTLASLVVYRSFKPMYAYMVEQALHKNIKPDSVLRKVLWWSLVLAVFAVISLINKIQAQPSLYYICTGVILVNIYMRLNTWGDKKIGLKDVWRDAKMGVSQAKKEILDLTETVSSMKKTENSAPLDKLSEEKNENKEIHALHSGRKKTKNTVGDVSKKVSPSKRTTRKITKKSPKTKRGE